MDYKTRIPFVVSGIHDDGSTHTRKKVILMAYEENEARVYAKRHLEKRSDDCFKIEDVRVMTEEDTFVEVCKEKIDCQVGRDRVKIAYIVLGNKGLIGEPKRFVCMATNSEEAIKTAEQYYKDRSEIFKIKTAHPMNTYEMVEGLPTWDQL